MARAVGEQREQREAHLAALEEAPFPGPGAEAVVVVMVAAVTPAPVAVKHGTDSVKVGVERMVAMVVGEHHGRSSARRDGGQAAGATPGAATPVATAIGRQASEDRGQRRRVGIRQGGKPVVRRQQGCGVRCEGADFEIPAVRRWGETQAAVAQSGGDQREQDEAKLAIMALGLPPDLARSLAPAGMAVGMAMAMGVCRAVVVLSIVHQI